MQRICTTARKDVVFFAYRVAMPRQRSGVKKHFSPNEEANTNNVHIPVAICDLAWLE